MVGGIQGTAIKNSGPWRRHIRLVRDSTHLLPIADWRRTLHLGHSRTMPVVGAILTNIFFHPLILPVLENSTAIYLGFLIYNTSYYHEVWVVQLPLLNHRLWG
jgi:hypothetical protein